MNLKNTKIDMSGKSEAEKEAFQKYVFNNNVTWYGSDVDIKAHHDEHFYIIDEDMDLLTVDSFGIYDGARDITEEWAEMQGEFNVEVNERHLSQCKPNLGFIAEKKPKVYGGSKEDVYSAMLDFEKDEEMEGWVAGEGKWMIDNIFDFHAFDVYKYEGAVSVYTKIRKLQESAEPVNPYEEIEENGKYKIVETGWGCDFLVINYNDAQDVLSSWVNHKDFEGFLFGDEAGYYTLSDCWSDHAGHAIGVKFRTNKGEE